MENSITGETNKFNFNSNGNGFKQSGSSKEVVSANNTIGLVNNDLVPKEEQMNMKKIDLKS